MPTYDYDIIASFPTVATNLIDIRHCDWVQADHYIEEAIYGYVKCEVTIFEGTQVSPIIYIDEQGNSSCPTGAWETYLTKGELDFILKWKIGKWVIIDGWWAVPKREGILPTPLKIPMERLLAYKEKTGLQAMLAKRMSVGIYGKFGEEREDSFGPHFCPAWFAEISTQVRLQVAEFISKHKLKSKLIHVSVDGVLLGERAYRPPKDIFNGQWKLSSVSPALIISSGLVYLANKKPKGLSLEEVLEIIREHPGQGYYEKKVVRTVTLGEALSSGKFEDLGKEKVMYSSIDLFGQKHDREFMNLPQTGEQLLKGHYKSKPKGINE